MLALVLAGQAQVAEAAETGGDPHPRPRSQTYRRLQDDLARGWNTWNTNSVVSHVHLPDGLAISLGIKPTWKGLFLANALRGNGRPEQVKLGLRADDGRYTSLDLAYAGATLKVESGTDGDDLVILVSAASPTEHRPHLIVSGGVLWSRPGSVAHEGEKLVARLPGDRRVEVGTTAALVPDAHVPLASPYLATALDGEIGIFTGRTRTVAEIKAILAKGRKTVLASHARWKELSEVFAAMQTVLAWNVIYDAENDRVIAPVSRVWNLNYAGYVLFDWDTYFASAMFGLHNKALAYANAVEITKSITPSGFVPNYATAYAKASFDRSQPPVGSRIIKELYKKYQERWLLDEVYDELLTWNRWWPAHRRNGPYLSWGTDLVPGSDEDRPRAVQFAKFESGLDNAPMFDGVPLRAGTGLLELGDVGLTALYVMDCDALSEIAEVLGKSADARELRERAAQYRKVVSGMWDEKAGIYRDRRTDTDQTSSRLAPTHFYPLLARAPGPQQAARMMKEHYANPSEFHGEFVLPSIARNDPAFKDNNYWRGRIWAPMNFLVYLGMRNYGVTESRRDLVERSRALLLKSWRDSQAVYENYNGTTGVGGDVRNADSFYHWGALLGFISFIERGDLPRPEAALK